MLGNILKLCFVFSLVVFVKGSALTRNKRQSDDDANTNRQCGDIALPHGGIKLYPIGSDHRHPHDDSCYTNPYLDCEYRLYCDDGYHAIGTNYLNCVYNVTSGEYKWAETFATCWRIETNSVGICEDMRVDHGGVKLYPRSSDNHHPDDDSCYTGLDHLDCEFRFYCDDGYESMGLRHIYCVRHVETGESKLVGTFPNCQRVHENYQCEDVTVPHGGIKLFSSRNGTLDPFDDTCYNGPQAWVDCEPRLYCDEGYEDSGTRYIYCGTSELSGAIVYKYTGDHPNCERKQQPQPPQPPQQPDSNLPSHTGNHDTTSDSAQWLRHHVYLVVSIVGVISVLGIALVVSALRKKNSRRQCVNMITPPSTASNGLSMGGQPGYARFDDSNVQVK